MLRLLCPRGHFIASVDITPDGGIIPHWTKPRRNDRVEYGLLWGYAQKQDLSCIRARCRRCGYDGSVDYAVLCAELAATASAGEVEHRLTT
jgi:hypothetical protein